MWRFGGWERQFEANGLRIASPKIGLKRNEWTKWKWISQSISRVWGKKWGIFNAIVQKLRYALAPRSNSFQMEHKEIVIQHLKMFRHLQLGRRLPLPSQFTSLSLPRPTTGYINPIAIQDIERLACLCASQDWDAVLHCIRTMPSLACAVLATNTMHGTLLHHIFFQASLSTSWNVIDLVLQHAPECLRITNASGYVPLDVLCCSDKLPREMRYA